MAAKAPSVNIVQHPDGWAVRRENAERASRVFHTQREAIDFGRRVAERERVELRVQSKTKIDPSTLTIDQILDEEWDRHESALRYLADR